MAAAIKKKIIEKIDSQFLTDDVESNACKGILQYFQERLGNEGQKQEFKTECVKLMDFYGMSKDYIKEQRVLQTYAHRQ
jgi:hypothetical protein